MGKNQKYPAAQRKFAQGVLIPPHSSTPAPVNAALNVCLRPAKTSCAVFLVGCSAKELLTRMSLGKVVSYENLQPLSLKLDSKSRPEPHIPQKNKGRTKRLKHHTQKKYFLRKRKPIQIDIISAFIEYLL